MALAQRRLGGEDMNHFGFEKRAASEREVLRDPIINLCPRSVSSPGVFRKIVSQARLNNFSKVFRKTPVFIESRSGACVGNKLFTVTFCRNFLRFKAEFGRSFRFDC